MRACINCGSSVKRNSNRFCSNLCQQAVAYNLYIWKWLNEKVSGRKGGGDVSGYVRRYIFSLRGKTCWKCGWSAPNPHVGYALVEIDHIDGNYRNCRRENLQVLCPNCHSLTDTYKNLNKGKGRKKKVVFTETLELK